ncbi:hypothetical protein EGW08_007027, partial [Elysia chlorotica]
MDESKRDTVVCIIRALWKKDAKILDLRSGHFYLHLLEMLEQWDKAGLVHSNDEDRLMCTKIFLEDYYGNDRETRIDDFLKFDDIVHRDKIESGDIKLELELSKIAIVLLGIGVLDKNSQDFMSTLLQVPLDKHYDVLAIIQSVIQTGSSEVALTSRIEEILCEPTENCQGVRPDTPNFNLLKSMEPTQASTPKDPSKTWTTAALASSSALPGSPLRVNLTLLNSSLRDITSPLRGLSIDASSSCSPLTQYAQSPQLIQKAILRQKETELRKLRRQMEEHIDRADELKYLLQDQVEAASQKDATIIQLEKRIQALQRQKLQTELSEKSDEENRNTIDTLNLKVQSLEHYKTQYEMLEKESSMHAEEIRKLYCEIRDLEHKNNHYKSMLDSKKNFEEDMKEQEIQLNTVVQQLQQMQTAKKEWETERQCMQEKINNLRDQIGSLRNELDDVNPLQHGNTSGETMGVVLDIQVEELKGQLNEAKQEQDKLQSLLMSNQDLLKEKEMEVLKLQDKLCVAQTQISEADSLVNHHATTLEQQNTKVQELTEQLEHESRLKSELQNSNDDLLRDYNKVLKQCSDYSEQISSLNTKILEKDECIEKIKSALEQKDYDLKSTQELVSCKDKLMETMRSEMETLAVSNTTLSEDLLKKDHKIIQLQQDCDKTIKESNEKQAELTANIDEIKENNLQTLSELQVSHVTELSNMKAQHEEVVKDMRQTAEQNASEFHALQKLLSQKEKELDDMKMEMNTVSGSLQSKAEQLEEKEDYIFELKADFEKQLEEMDQNKCELQALIEKLQKELDQMIQQFQMIEKELVLKTEEACQKEEQIHKIQSDFEMKAESAEHNSKAALESLKAEIEAVKNGEIELFSKQLEAQKNDAEKKINEKEIELEKLERTVKELIDERKSLSAKLEESVMKLHDSKAQAHTKSMEISEKIEMIKGLKTTFEQQLEEMDQNKCELQAFIEKLKKERDEVIQQFQMMEKELTLKTEEACQKEEQIYKIQSDFEMKAKAAEHNSKAALESLKAEIEAVKNGEIEMFSKQLEAQKNDAEKKINEKEIELEKLERTVKELIDERKSLSAKLEESEMKLQDAKAQVHTKSMDIEEKEETIKSLKQDFEKKLFVQNSNEKTLGELQEKIESLKETNIQALREKETHYNLNVSQIKMQYEQSMNEITKSIREKDVLLVELQKTIENNNFELEKSKSNLESAQSVLKQKDEEILSCRQELTRLEKLWQDKERLIASVTEDYETQLSMNKANHNTDMEAKLKAAENVRQEALSKQKASHDSEMAKQKEKHEEEVQKLVEANQTALERYKAAQTDAEQRAEEQLKKEREEHGKLIEALGQDSDKEREGYLQSLLVKRQEVEQLSAQLKDSQSQLVQQEQLSVNNKKELARIQEDLKKEKEKCSHAGDLLSTQMSKNKEIEEMYKSLKSEMEQLELKLTETELQLEKATEFSSKQSNDLDQAKCNVQQITHELNELHQSCTRLRKTNEHLEIKLDENSKLSIAECQSLKNNIVEKENLVENLSYEVKQKDEKISTLEQTLADQNSHLETLSLTLDCEKKKSLESKELINLLQQDIVNKEERIDKINKNFEEHRLSVEKENQTLISELELKYKAAKECELKTLSDQREAFKEEMERLQSEKEQKLQELIINKSHLESENQNLKQDLDAKTKQHFDMTTEIEAFVRKASETESQLSNMKETLEEKTVDLANYQKEITDSKRKLQSMENELQLKVEEVSEKEQIITNLKNDFAEQINQLQSGSKDVQLAIQSKFEETLRNEIAKATEQRTIIENYKQQLDELTIKYKNEVMALNEEIAQLHLRIKQLEEQEKSFLSQQDASQNLLKQKEEKAEQLYRKVQDLEQLGKLQQSEYDQSQENIVKKEEEVTALQKKIESYSLQLCEQKELLDEKEQTISKCQLKLESYELQVNKAKKEKAFGEEKYKDTHEQNVRLEKQVRGLKESCETLIEKEKKSKSKLLEMAVKYETMQKENKQYVSEINRLKTSLDFSERKLRECQKQLDTVGTALLGDSSHFQKVIAKSSPDDSLAGSPDSIGSSRSLRSRSRLSSGNNSFQSGLNETILSGDTVLLKRETIASSADLKKRMKPSKSTEDRISIRSSFSSHSTKSTIGMPGVHMPFAACANEPDGPDFEWDRLSELQRRNTMYLPHLKSAYPIEMQTVETEKFSDEGLRLSTVGDHAKEKFETRSSGRAIDEKIGVKAPKRTAPVMRLKEELSEPSPPKQLRSAPNYHRPGPPTPGKQPRRVSGAFSPLDQTLSPASTGKTI